MEKVHETVNGDQDSLGKIHQAFRIFSDMKGIGDSIKKLKDGKFSMDDVKHPTYLR